MHFNTLYYDKIFEKVEATMSVDQHIGSILGIQTLDRCQVNDENCEKYDLLIKDWSESEDVTVQILLNQYQCKLWLATALELCEKKVYKITLISVDYDFFLLMNFVKI